MKQLYSILIFLLLGNFSNAQSSKLSVALDKDQILIGDQIQMTVMLKTGSSDSISFPILKDTLVKEIEIISTSKFDTVYDENDLNVRTISQNLTLTSFDSGYYAIAPITALVNGDAVESNPFLISVQTVAIDTAKGFYDIRGVSEVPFPIIEWLKEYWPWIIFPILFLALLTYVMLRWSKRPAEEIPEKIEPEIPAHIIALEKLKKLEDQKLWQDGKIKEFYSELTEILREYIELRYGIPALEQTTDEIIASMKRMPDFRLPLIEKTHRLLYVSDLVKFAKEKPIGSENETNLNNVLDFIVETKPDVEQEKPETNA